MAAIIYFIWNSVVVLVYMEGFHLSFSFTLLGFDPSGVYSGVQLFLGADQCDLVLLEAGSFGAEGSVVSDAVQVGAVWRAPPRKILL